MQALVTGATGFVGRHLLRRLEQPVVLSRDATKARRELADYQVRPFPWQPENQPPAEAFAGIDTVFHLAGDPVAKGRWNAAKKARIRDSRVVGTRNLVAGLARLSERPRVLVCASAVGYYGSRGEVALTEGTSPGSDFLAQVCVDWEREALTARNLGIRVVPIRIGIVLGPAGGALAQMLPPFRAGLGSPLGSGRQYMPWIHIDDLVELMLFVAGRDNVNGPLNGVAPTPVTNREFTHALGRALHRPTFLPAVPAFALKALLGEFAEVLLASQRVIPQAATNAGFTFRHPQLQPAFAAILNGPLKPG
jgi:uncharacterized protein (TIGR01777 family)